MECRAELTVLVAASSLLIATSAAATPEGPVFPTPGGPTSTINDGGNIARAGGRTFTFSGFDFGAVDEIYWGPTDDFFVPAPGVGAAMDGSIDSPGEFLTFDSVLGYYTGDTTIDITNVGTLAVETRFVVTVLDGGTSLFDASSLGIGSETQAVAEITGDPFEFNAIFEARFAGGTGWTGFLDFFDAQQTTGSGLARTDFQGALYYTPEPGTALLTGAGLLAMAGASRRRRTV